jgi:hypothetical protein
LNVENVRIMATLLRDDSCLQAFSLESPAVGRQMTSKDTGAATALVIMIGHDEWRIYELDPAFYDRRGAKTLVFESDGVIRRVRSYPDNWRQLSHEALLTLSWTA